MAFTLLQVGNMLKTVNGSGGLSAALALPSGVVLATNRTPRFAKFKRYVIVVNTPSRPLSVSDTGVVRVLTPNAPVGPVALTGPNAGTLTGTYLSLQTYQILDLLGNVIAESDYGPAMGATVTIAGKKLLATFAVSPDAVTATQLYRTTTSGGVYFPWTRVSNNTSTTAENDLSDASLGIVAGPVLGSAPDLTLIAEFGGRLFGVDRTNVDDLRYTEAGTMYAWSALNTLPIPHVGSDAAGITALISRRAALGVGRRDMLVQITGDSRTNFKPTTVNGGEQCGVISQESVVVFNDVAYFLWRDGVYRWDSQGVRCITNGRVRSWFASDTYFNRSMFWRSFAQLDPFGLKYRLFLASPGSIVVDRWIEYDLTNETWWGPHSTTAFTPTSAVLVAGNNQQPYFMIGSAEGYLSQDQDTRRDWADSIALDVKTNEDEFNDPDYEKYFGELTIMGEQQETGTLTITPTVGEVGSTTSQASMAYDMKKTRQRLGRLGVGKSMSLGLTNNTFDEDVMIYGYEVTPVNVVGRR